MKSTALFLLLAPLLVASPALAQDLGDGSSAPPPPGDSSVAVAVDPNAPPTVVAPIAVPAPAAAPVMVGAISVPSFAPDADASDATRSYQMYRTLQYWANQDRRMRLLSGGVMLAGAAGFGIAGGVMLRDTVLAPAGYAAIGAAAGFAVGGLLSMVIPSPMMQFAAEYRGLLGHGSAVDAIRAAEVRWAVLADQARTARRVAGVLGIVAGGLLGVASVAAPFVLPRLSGAPSFVDATAVLAGTMGITLVGGGIAALLIDSDVERGLQLWRAGHARPPAGGVRWTPPGVWVSQSGFGVAIGGRF